MADWRLFFVFVLFVFLNFFYCPWMSTVWFAHALSGCNTCTHLSSCASHGHWAALLWHQGLPKTFSELQWSSDAEPPVAANKKYSANHTFMWLAESTVFLLRWHDWLGTLPEVSFSNTLICRRSRFGDSDYQVLDLNVTGVFYGLNSCFKLISFWCLIPVRTCTRQNNL